MQWLEKKMANEQEEKNNWQKFFRRFTLSLGRAKKHNNFQAAQI